MQFTLDRINVRLSPPWRRWPDGTPGSSGPGRSARTATMTSCCGPRTGRLPHLAISRRGGPLEAALLVE